MAKRTEAKVLVDVEDAYDNVKDDNVKVEDWNDYLDKVEKKEIEPPKEVRRKKNPRYAFNVDKALDCIDLSFSNYKPSADALQFFNVIRLILGEDPEVPNALMHYFLIDLIFGNVKREQFPYKDVEIKNNMKVSNKKLAILAARGSSKSTIMTAFLPLYIAVTGKIPNFGTVTFMVAVGDSQRGGAKVMANTIRDFCVDSAFCKEYFDVMRFTDEECEFIRKGDGPVNKRAFLFKTKGASSGLRGIRYRTRRPQIIAFDDLVAKEADASSPIIMNKLKSLIYSDAGNALDAKKRMMFAVNTPYNKNDPIYEAIESGIWTPVVLPICEKIDLDLTEEEFVGSWPQMHSYESVMERYEDAYYGNKLREFNQELMLRITSEENRLIKEDDILWYDRNMLKKQLGNFTIIITTDFTANNGSAKADYSGIAVWAISADDDKYLLDLELKRQSIQDQYLALFRMVSKWGRGGRMIEVGIEVDGQQRLNLFALKRMMIEKNIWFRFAHQKGAAATKEGISSRAVGSKLERLKHVAIDFERHKIFFPEQLEGTEDMKEMLEEIRYVTYTAIGSQADDGLDLLSQVKMIDYILPTNGVDLGTDDNLTEADRRVWGDMFDDDDDEFANSVVF